MVFRDLVAEWATSEVAPLSILVDLWIEHKLKVAARRSTTPPFDWLDANRDIGRLQFRLQAVVLQQISQTRLKDEGSKQSPGRQLSLKKEKSPDSDRREEPMSKRKVKKLAHAAKVEGLDKSQRLCKYGNDGCRAFLATGKCEYLHKK